MPFSHVCDPLDHVLDRPRGVSAIYCAGFPGWFRALLVGALP